MLIDLIDKKIFFFVIFLVIIKYGSIRKKLKENFRMLERKCCFLVWLIVRIFKFCFTMFEFLKVGRVFFLSKWDESVFMLFI